MLCNPACLDLMTGVTAPLTGSKHLTQCVCVCVCVCVCCILDWYCLLTYDLIWCV